MDTTVLSWEVQVILSKWTIDSAGLRPEDDEHYASWYINAKRVKDGYCIGTNQGSTQAAVEQHLVELILEFEKFDALEPMEKLEHFLGKSGPQTHLLSNEVTACIKAIYAELKTRQK